MGGDKRALALAAYQQMFFGELVYGFAHRALADLEARGQLEFAGNQVAGLPLPCLQAFQYQFLDLLVQRAEKRRQRPGLGSLAGGIF